jgi:hypothetical protein
MRWFFLFLLATPAYAQSTIAADTEMQDLQHDANRLQRAADASCPGERCAEASAAVAAMRARITALTPAPGPLPSDTPPDLGYVGASPDEQHLWRLNAIAHGAWRRACMDAGTPTCAAATAELNRAQDAIRAMHRAVQP